MDTMRDVLSGGGKSSFSYPDYSEQERKFLDALPAFLKSVECSNRVQDEVFLFAQVEDSTGVENKEEKKAKNIVDSRQIVIESTNVRAPQDGAPAMRPEKPEAKMDDSIFGPPDVSANFPPKEEKSKPIQAAGEDDIFGPPAVAVANPAPPVAAPAAKESTPAPASAKSPNLVDVLQDRALAEVQKQEDAKVFSPALLKTDPFATLAPAEQSKSSEFDYDMFHAFMVSAKKCIARADVPDSELEKIAAEVKGIKCFESLDIDALRVEPRQLFEWSLRVRAKLDYLHALQVKVNVLSHTLKRQYDRMKKVATTCSGGKNVTAREVEGEKMLMEMGEKFELVSYVFDILDICYRDLTNQAQFLSRQMNWFEDRSGKEKSLYGDGMAEKPSLDGEKKEETDDFQVLDAGAKPVDVPSTEKLESFNQKKAETKSDTKTGIVSFGDF